RAMLDRAGVPAARQRMIRTVDARYPRQSYELVVPVPEHTQEETPAQAPEQAPAKTPQPIPGREVIAAIAEAFHDRHAQTYGHARPDEAVQLVNLRLSAVGEIPGIHLAQPAQGGAPVKGIRPVWFRAHGRCEATVYDRAALAAEHVSQGPAVIESLDSTILVPPGWTARMDRDGFVHMTRTGAEA
ncbi:MAG: hypothetical protein AAF334_08440, partial [Pseudomonadota bacterium]